MKKPGYPARPRSAKKDFCVKCPPKKPCNLNKCPPDSEGTCRKADLQRRDLLKLISESQATCRVTKTTLSRSAMRFLVASTWNVGHHHLHDHASCFREVQRRFFSDCSGKSSKKPPPCSKSSPIEPECKPPKKQSSKGPQNCKTPPMESKGEEKKCIDKPKCSESPSPPIALKCKETEREPKVLYQKCPPLPKLPKLPKCPKPPEPKMEKPCAKITAPKCPPPPSLPKCPECPKLPAKKKDECPPEPEKPTAKCFPQKTNSAGKCSSSLNCPEDDSHGGAAKNDVEKKKKSLWEKITDCKKRKMSTYHRSYQIDKNFDNLMVKNHRRHLSTSDLFLSSFSSKSGGPPSLPPWKTRKCKTIEEVCGEEEDPKLKALECKPMNCSKDPNAACYPEKPRCAEVRKDRKRDHDKTFAGIKRKVGASGKKMDDYVPSSVVKAPIEKIDYSKFECEPPKLTKLGPCPAPPQCFNKMRETEQCETYEKIGKAAPSPLPKSPSAPVVLCPCPPPPKLHPGSCPCYVEAENSEIKPLAEPCPAKPKYPCPEVRAYYCPPTKAISEMKKECDDKKKPTKP